MRDRLVHPIQLLEKGRAVENPIWTGDALCSRFCKIHRRFARGSPHEVSAEKNRGRLALTDPDHLKSAAEYLLQVTRSSEGRRYRKQPKIDALRQYKEEIFEAHR